MYRVSEILLFVRILLNNIFQLRSIKNQIYTLVTACDEAHFIYLEKLLVNFKKVAHFDNFIIYRVITYHKTYNQPRAPCIIAHKTLLCNDQDIVTAMAAPKLIPLDAAVDFFINPPTN